MEDGRVLPERNVHYSDTSGQLYAQSRRQLPSELVDYLVTLAMAIRPDSNQVTVLERGAGQGTFTAQMIDCLQRKGASYSYLAEEPEPALQEILVDRQLPGLYVTPRLAEHNIAYGDDQFDLIVDCNVLYLLDQRYTNRKIHQLLWPAGGMYAGVLRYINERDFQDLWHLFAILPPNARGYEHPADMKNLGPFLEKLDSPFEADRQAGVSFGQQISYTKRELLTQLVPSSDRYLAAESAEDQAEMLAAVEKRLGSHPRFAHLGPDEPIPFSYDAHALLGQRIDDPDNPPYPAAWVDPITGKIQVDAHRAGQAELPIVSKLSPPGATLPSYTHTHPPATPGTPLRGRRPYSLPRRMKF